MTTKPAPNAGTPEAPWNLKTPPGTASHQAWRDPTLDSPALEALGLAEVEHNPKNNRMRAVQR